MSNNAKIALAAGVGASLALFAFLILDRLVLSPRLGNPFLGPLDPAIEERLIEESRAARKQMDDQTRQNLEEIRKLDPKAYQDFLREHPEKAKEWGLTP